MKRVFVLLLVAVVAITGVFADVLNQSAGNSHAGSTSVDISLELTDSDFTFHKIGFSTDNIADLSKNDPTPASTIVLNYDKQTHKAVSDDRYVYYYVSGAKLPTITLKCGNGLTGGEGGTIAYKAVVKGADINSGSESELTLNSLSEGVSTEYQTFHVETTTPLNATFSGSFSDTMTLTIKAA